MFSSRFTRGLIILLALLANGCSCKTSYLPPFHPVELEDKRLNCYQLVYALNEAEYWLKNVDQRCTTPHVFAKFIPCTPAVKLDAARNGYVLQERIDYLKSLYRFKHCNQAVMPLIVEKSASRLRAVRDLPNN